jgi:adenosylcobyric acid synthase
MRGPVLMVQGTMSSVGKSLVVAALCRLFRQDGLRVAPFKAQNMALNSFVTRDGREIGRAQAMQAAAAGVDITVEMNPILIKPEADSFAQVVVLGRPWARLPAGEYMRRRGELWQVVTAALDSLRAQYDLVIIEGAGSPVELNLRQSELVNMAIAAHAQAPVLLVGDIDRGGIFAQLLGTLMLLEDSERALVRGLIVNKFRGDRQLFADGTAILEQRGGVPVIGVLPFLRDLRLPDEDSVALDDRRQSPAERQSVSDGALDIAVIRLPHISNFDDFDPLMAEADTHVRFVERAEDLGRPDLLILPGTKTTIADLCFLQECGLAARIGELARSGTPTLGICGGYQMLGRAIHDPTGVESNVPELAGLGLLPVVTTFEDTKQTVRAQGQIIADRGLFATANQLPLSGYEIHMGRTLLDAGSMPLVQVTARREVAVADSDGAVTTDGWIAGTYFHGLFDNDALRHTMLGNLAARKGRSRMPSAVRFDREAAYDQLADAARMYLDLATLYEILK